MNDEASGSMEYTFTGKANSKFFQQKFTLSRAARAYANPQSTLFTAYRLYLCLARKLLGPIMDNRKTGQET